MIFTFACHTSHAFEDPQINRRGVFCPDTRCGSQCPQYWSLINCNISIETGFLGSKIKICTRGNWYLILFFLYKCQKWLATFGHYNKLSNLIIISCWAPDNCARIVTWFFFQKWIAHGDFSYRHFFMYIYSYLVYSAIRSQCGYNKSKTKISVQPFLRYEYLCPTLFQLLLPLLLNLSVGTRYANKYSNF